MALTFPRAVTPGRVRLSAWRLNGDLPWLCGASVVLVVMCGLPYVVSAMWGPANLDRLGTFWFVRDFTQYQAAMREGAEQSGWLIHDHFSAESHQAAFIYPLYVAVGKLAALTRADPLVLFGALEWLGRLLLLGTLYAFAAAFTAHRPTRRLAVVLAAGSLGLIGLTAPARGVLEAVGAQALADHLPAAINVYLELSSFGVFLSAPHLMLGLTLTLVCGLLYLRRQVVWLGLAVLALSLLHPFNLPVLISVLLVHAAWNGKAWWLPAIVAALAAAPILLYNALLFTIDPFWSGTYGTQNLMPAPSPWLLPFDFGILLLAAPLAWSAMRTWPTEQRRLMLLWIGLGLAWLYVPVPYQRRFAFGVQPALAVVAAVGLVQLNRAYHNRYVNLGLAALVMATPVLVYVALIDSAATNAPTEVYLWSRAEAEAGAWIGDHSSADDVVLASTEFANPLAGSIDGRVVHGHIVATFANPTKKALVDRFFSDLPSAPERSELLASSGATMVAFGPRERALGVSDLAGQAELRLVYDRDGVQVFRVAR